VSKRSRQYEQRGPNGGAGNDEAGQRARASIEFIGDAFQTDAATFARLLAQRTRA
jgi:hypothetical protein